MLDSMTSPLRTEVSSQWYWARRTVGVTSAAGALITCSAATPPATPVTSGSDAGHNAASATAGAAASVSIDPIQKLPLPGVPDPHAWADVLRPTAGSVNLDKPGGDAADPDAAALVRLLEEPLGALRDKDNQVALSYPDSRNWKRVRYRLFEHLVGFRYGSRFEAVNVVLVNDTRAGRVSESRACIRQAETIARPRIRALSVVIGEVQETEITWKEQRIVVHSVDGAFPWGFHRIEFSAAWAAYPAYDKTCLIHGIGVRHEKRADLAHLVRDRWILEVAPKLETLTTTKPYRH
jgi:hypothetical protein